MQTTNSTSEYLLLVRGSDWDRSLSPAELQTTLSSFMGWFDRLSAEGILKTGQPLQDEIRVIHGKTRAVDGPFVEAKEAVGGYFLIQAESIEDAISIAQSCPMLEQDITLEVRAIASECPTVQRCRVRIEEAAALA